MNIEALLDLKATILAEPMRLNMAEFSDDDTTMRPACDTVACLAGWAVARRRLRDGIVDGMGDLLDGYRGDYVPDAQEILGLTYNEALRLFYVGFWPAEFKEPVYVSEEGAQYYASQNLQPGDVPEWKMAAWPVAGNLQPQTREYALLTAARLDRFMATGGRA